MEVFIAHLVDEDGRSDLVGVYPSFDKCVDGTDTHKDWYGRSGTYICQALQVGMNNTLDCARYMPFTLAAGQVPSYHLRGSKHHDRFY